MSKKQLRNPMERMDNMSVAYEINDQDLVGKSGGINITMTLRGKCGRVFTLSYECNGGTRCG